jgi:hypothetical protein
MKEARLIDRPTSEGLETFSALIRCSDFSAELGKFIRQPGGAERAVLALRREFLPQDQPVVEKFSAPIVYVQPEFEELKRRFPAFINLDYSGKRFDPIERCKAVSKENREVAFEYVHMDRDASTDEVLAEMDRKGLRPALYEELLGFALKYPDEQLKYPIVALGSGTSVRGLRYGAFLWYGDDGRYLDLRWIDYDWYAYYRFLAVRK